MAPLAWIRPLFLIAALYDGVLGAVFLVAPRAPFRWFDVPPPGHVAYVQFSAALLLIFGLMFWQVFRDPLAHRSLMVYGMLLKIAYCGVVFGHWLAGGISGMWKPFAVIDLAMLAAFAAAWSITGRMRAEPAA